MTNPLFKGAIPALVTPFATSMPHTLPLRVILSVAVVSVTASGVCEVAAESR